MRCLMNKLLTEQFKEDIKEVSIICAVKTTQVAGTIIINTTGFVLNQIDKVRNIGK